MTAEVGRQMKATVTRIHVLVSRRASFARPRLESLLSLLTRSRECLSTATFFPGVLEATRGRDRGASRRLRPCRRGRQVCRRCWALHATRQFSFLRGHRRTRSPGSPSAWPDGNWAPLSRECFSGGSAALGVSGQLALKDSWTDIPHAPGMMGAWHCIVTKMSLGPRIWGCEMRTLPNPS